VLQYPCLTFSHTRTFIVYVAPRALSSPNTMSLLILNDDILHVIADMLSAAECTPLSSVSRHLHAVARKYVFASIIVYTMEQLVKMHDHLIRNIDNRLIWPRGLTIYAPTGMGAAWQPSAINALVGIFEHARELKVLELYGCEDAIWCNTLVGEHLAALPNLLDIRLYDVGTKTLDVLHKMVSRPERAELSAMIKHDRFATDIARAPVLDNAKELRLYEFDDVPPLRLLSSLAGSHPQVEILHLGSCVVYPCLILFPNIRELTTDICQFDPPVPGLRVEQRHLDYLSVEVGGLRRRRRMSAPGIQSDYLRLYTKWQGFDPSEVDHELVSAAVVLELSWYGIERPTECISLAQVISAKLSRIRYLVLTIEDSYAAVTQWMADISSSLSSSQLLCIRVHVTHANEGGPLRERWLDVLQRLERAHISSVPSLRFYFQHIEGIDDQRKPSGPSKTTWGRVEGEGGDRAVQPIPSWQGERIHRYLQSPEFCRTLRFDEGAALQYTGRQTRRES